MKVLCCNAFFAAVADDENDNDDEAGSDEDDDKDDDDDKDEDVDGIEENNFRWKH